MRRDLLEARAKKHWFFKGAHKFISHKAFEGFISVAIVANTVLLGFDRYPIDAQEELIHEYLNYGFQAIFFFEMCFKIAGLGFKIYFEDRFNIFDFFLVTISVVESTLN